MTIRAIPEWAVCRQIANWVRQFHEAQEIFKAASPAQLDELIAIAESGEPADRHVALSVLEHIARAKYDLRWNLDRRDHLIRLLRKYVIEEYPQDIARHAVSLLRQIDYPWLDEFLGAFPLDQISQENCSALVYDLGNQLTEQARIQLIRMAQAGWEDASRIKWTVNALCYPRRLSPTNGTTIRRRVCPALWWARRNGSA